MDGATVYASRRFDLPRHFGDVVLGDFGETIRGDVKRNHDAQPDVYRSPEVMLETEWSYPVDIWNVGVMVRTRLDCPSPSRRTLSLLTTVVDLGPLRRTAPVLW